jgi:hypothetical protein
MEEVHALVSYRFVCMTIAGKRIHSIEAACPDQANRFHDETFPRHEFLYARPLVEVLVR